MNPGTGKKNGQDTEIYMSQWQWFKALGLKVVDRGGKWQNP